MGRPVGCGPSGKFLVLLPTADRFTALASCGPSLGGDYGGDRGVYLPDVVAWFRALDRDFPFTLWGAGRDFIDIEFDRPITEPESLPLARRVYDFCPDAVHQSTVTRGNLAKLIRDTGRVHFWWD
jgi:hypothetical protein